MKTSFLCLKTFDKIGGKLCCCKNPSFSSWLGSTTMINGVTAH